MNEPVIFYISLLYSLNHQSSSGKIGQTRICTADIAFPMKHRCKLVNLLTRASCSGKDVHLQAVSFCSTKRVTGS